MVAFVVAWELLTTSRRAPDETVSVTPPWRFSGRWFDSPRRVV
jgi:hypothetical protein